jgi:hypothetical protein
MSAPNAATPARGITRIKRRTMRKALRVNAGVKRRYQRWSVISKLAKHGVGAEIGVWEGDYSAKLLMLARPTRLHLIDAWHAFTESQADQLTRDSMYEGVCRRFADMTASGRVVIHRALSTEVLDELEPLDWVYLDGSHTYEGVRADLESYYALVKPGGVIAGDDYAVGGFWEDGVIRAVDEFVRSHGLELTVMGQQFFFTKPV